jgi:hypothetical protein
MAVISVHDKVATRLEYQKLCDRTRNEAETPQRHGEGIPEDTWQNTRPLTINTENDLNMNSALLFKVFRKILGEAGLMQFPVSQ